ncbi:MAG: M23 family metallopeptidase [Sphingobium sp.]|nr:M23 family metallopeptidase [Sphingobium sp.]MCP5398450.1 M23 family metallopeptidase [Sphingomonas sp.]
MEGKAQQGGRMRGRVPTGTRGLLFNGEPVSVDEDGRFFIAFDRDAEKSAKLEAVLDDGSVVLRELTVAPGDWRLEHVNANYTGRATSEEFRRVRAGELKRIQAARAVNARSDGWKQDFIWPLKGRITGAFGAQRIYRGKPGSYHGGTDIAAPSGTAFVAPADGVVVLAAVQPFTLEGRLLIVDHGMGLNSAFLHCSSLRVKEGDVVRQGQALGTVGMTGRASGPHLHWGMMWKDARIDAAILAGAVPERH